MIDKERLINTFIDVVAIPCASKHEKKVADYIINQLNISGYNYVWDHVEKITGGECGNIIVTLPASFGCNDRAGIFFEAHMDCVDPCSGTIVVRKDGILYSDGTTVLGGDDKVGVVSMLEVLKSLKEDNAPHGLIQMFFTVNEEIGCLGAKYSDKKLIKAQFGYCLDSHGDIGTIIYKSPKQEVYKVVVRGQSAHAGLEPEKGINAIMLASKALAAIPKYGRIDDETTLNVGIIKGGIATNIVADECEFTLDIRSLNENNLNNLRDNIFDVMKSVVENGKGSINFLFSDGCPICNIKEDSYCIRLAERAAINLGAVVRLEKSGGCSDANYYTKMGYPTLCLGTGMNNIHTTMESLKEDDLYNTALWMKEIITLCCK